jgi:hypothetical protein
MSQLFSNAARSTLQANILAGDTSLTVASADADLFPVATTGTGTVGTAGLDYFKMVLEDSSHNKEIIFVRTRAAASAIFSNVLRGQEGTTARAYTAGDVVGLRITALDYQYVFAEKPFKGHFYKLDNSVAFTKTAANTVSIKAGTEVVVGAALLTFAADTAITMPALTAGTDYAIYAKPDGTLQAVADPYSAPSAPPIAGARKIGGFHYGLTAPGTTVAGGSFAAAGTGMIWTQPSVDDIAGIDKYSLWDVKWRCAGEQRGMAFDPYVQAWAAIYWCPTNHITNGISAAGTDVASGSVLPRIPLAYGGTGATNYANGNWWTFGEIAASFGLRHPTEREFVSAAYGVTENQSLGGASVTIPATARQAGYTSRIGLEQASGHIWTWGADSSYRHDGTAVATNYDVNGGRGQIYMINSLGLIRVLLGGVRYVAAASGSRASSWSDYPWNSNWYIGLRAFGDHLKLA